MSDIAEPLAELPARGWTPERKMLFLDRLAVSGNARAAYRQRRKDPLFARAWAAAVLLGRDASQQVLADRAVDGIEEDEWHRGEVVGTRRRYDTRLLLAHLARLDNLASEEAAGDAAVFEDLLTRIGSGDTAEGPTERQRYIQRETDRAVDEARRAQLTVELEEDDDHPRETHIVPEWDIDRFFGSDAEAVRADMEEAEQEAEEEARRDAAERWDRLERNRDTAFNPPSEKRQTVSPDTLPDAVKAVLSPSTHGTGSPPPFPVPVRNPRTASTVSTAALVGAIAGPPPGFAMTSRSPFDAPRALQRR